MGARSRPDVRTPLRNLAGGDGRRVLLDIDVQGAAQVRGNVPSAVLVFLLPPSLETLLARLSGRGTEPRDEVARRLGVARDELARVPEFDHVLVNDDLEATVAAVRAIARGEGAEPAWRAPPEKGRSRSARGSLHFSTGISIS